MEYSPRRKRIGADSASRSERCNSTPARAVPPFSNPNREHAVPRTARGCSGTEKLQMQRALVVQILVGSCAAGHLILELLGQRRKAGLLGTRQRNRHAALRVAECQRARGVAV